MYESSAGSAAARARQSGNEQGGPDYTLRSSNHGYADLSSHIPSFCLLVSPCRCLCLLVVPQIDSSHTIHKTCRLCPPIHERGMDA